MKTRYEYDIIVDRPSGLLCMKATNREQARYWKRLEKSVGGDAKIIQRVYKLTEEKEIR